MTEEIQIKKEKSSTLSELFENAKADGLYNYVLVLIRPKGVSQFPDPLWTAYQNFLLKKEFIPTENMLIESFSLIFNLNEHISKKEFTPFPFTSQCDSEGFSLKPRLKDIVQYLADTLKKSKQDKLSEEIKEIFSEDVLDAIKNSVPTNFNDVNLFLKELITFYFEARLEFNKIPSRQLYKLPRFDVFELLKNDTYGLYGFNVYFSNGSHANYERIGEKTSGINLMTGATIIFNVGMLSDLKKHWMIKDKHLYEIGLPGRYNTWGEWKPLIYEGDHDFFLKESLKIAEQDYQIAGILFYVMCTGHRIIEFTAKTPIEMPEKNFSLGDRMHLHKCDKTDSHNHSSQDFVLYDGHYDLKELTPHAIRSAIASINVGLNRMAFAYNSSIDWCLKYSIVQHDVPVKPTPTVEELKTLNSMLVDFPNGEDAIILDICLDWYHRGELAHRKNVFLAFLCYYIAIESVAIAITEGDASLGLEYTKETKTGRKDRVANGIKKLHDELYDTDPEEFIKKAYFEEVVPLKQRTQRIIELVFGKNNQYSKLLFEKKDGKPSLADLRSELAHGGVTLLDPNHKNMIRERLPELREIVSDFVKKIINKPGQEFPEWSGGSSMSIFPSDPRDTMIANSDKNFFGTNDWKIKPEWLD
ncbi:MAG: hypothetical protein P4L63_03430 [Candidatus Pacebacteria bacterium]|nr:hypothetical protein [Candidatus Paceibacterota bacterium]